MYNLKLKLHLCMPDMGNSFPSQLKCSVGLHTNSDMHKRECICGTHTHINNISNEQQL